MSGTGRPWICAHRGASSTFPDNSLAAFEAALATGCEAIETDLRRGVDGRIVLAHDQVDADRADVVDLASLLALANGHVRLDLELKEAGLESDLLAMIGGDSNAIVSSFSAAVLRRIREVAPSLETGLLVEPPSDANLMVAAEEAGADTVIVEDSLLTASLLKDAANCDRDVWVWTVNDEERLAELLAEPLIACVITDVPDRAVTIRASIGQHIAEVREA